MTDTPNFRFYRHPRFSANQLADYLCTNDAGQRDAVIRKAKFPRKVATVAYQQVVPAIRAFLTKPDAGFVHIDGLRGRLEAKALAEVDWQRDEAIRCVAAIDAFKAAYASTKWGKVGFQPGPQDVSMKHAGVTINARLDPPVIERKGDDAFAGGCVLFFSNTEEGRKNIAERRKYVAATVHWALAERGQNIQPLPKLCMSFDVFGNEIVRAPTSFQRLRKAMTDACREAAAKWDGVEPPYGYDGPDWH